MGLGSMSIMAIYHQVPRSEAALMPTQPLAVLGWWRTRALVPKRQENC